tara:strand:+ start:108 stop:485 length:378 start_codon:yes stop_codon:yes gene_type:complete
MLNFLDLDGFYKGKLSLKKSFWLYFVLLYLFVVRLILGLIYVFLIRVLGVQGFENFNIIGVVNLLVFFFVLVGTWRSASNLAGQTYQEKVLYANVAWSWLTKFILLVTLVQVLYPYYLYVRYMMN